ncbi:PEP-CTERM sorting domain-containing protein [Pirellulales bacterium]|nr:PEP-CTERM sorting domain-containing protein [Pirellulales bacterium]
MKKRLNVFELVAVVLAVACSNQSAWGTAPSIEPLPLIPEDMLPRDSGYGWWAAIEHDTALVAAAPDLVSLRVPAGAIYAFDWETGAQVNRLDPPAEVTGGDGFGAGLDISGNRGIVGTTPVPSNRADPGAYIFDLQTGEPTRRLEDPSPDTRDFFGIGVGIDERWAVVGAPLFNERAGGSGAVYTYDRQNNYARSQIDAPNDLGSESRFGLDVAVDGDSIVVGAPESSSTESIAGAAYLFDLSKGTQTLLQSPNPRPLGQFGRSVDISGNLAIVGSVFEGRAYVFDVRSGELVSELVHDAEDVMSWFGFSVAIDGDIAVVGAPRDSRFGNQAGAAFVFDTHTGQQIELLSPASLTDRDLFGQSVAVDGRHALVTALGQNEGMGGAYVFQIVPEPSTLALAAIAAVVVGRRIGRQRAQEASSWESNGNCHPASASSADAS